MFKQPGAQNLAHVNRRGGQKDTLVSALVPVNEIAFVRFEKERELLPDFETPARDAQQLLRLLGHRRKLGFQPLQRADQSVITFAMLLKEGFALVSFERISAVACRERIKKCSAALANPLRFSQQRRGPEVQQPHANVGVARQFLETIVRNLPAKIVAGHVFHFVRFVKHHRGIFR